MRIPSHSKCKGFEQQRYQNLHIAGHYLPRLFHRPLEQFEPENNGVMHTLFQRRHELCSPKALLLHGV